MVKISRISRLEVVCKKNSYAFAPPAIELICIVEKHDNFITVNYATGRGKSDTGLREELLGLPSRGRKRRQPVEDGRRGAVQVDGRSAPG